MRCISPHSRYSYQVIQGKEKVVMDTRGYADTIVVDTPVSADFFPGGLMNHEIEAALDAFSFSGLPEGVNPLARIGVFDSEAFVMTRYPEDERNGMQVKIDKALREGAQRYPTQFIVVDPPQAPRPWPSYDDDSVKDVLAFQDRLRVSPELVRLYEVENKNRPEIVLAMLKKEDPAAAERFEAEQAGENAEEAIEVVA